MFLARTEYDRGVNTFSPEGRLFQVEYALEAIKLGSTAIGLRTNAGVVLAVEKKLSLPLIEPDSVEKVMEVDSHCGAAMSGLVADARILIDKARMEAAKLFLHIQQQDAVKSIAQSVSDTAIGFGKGDDMPSRPFGVALLLAGCDKEDGPQLYNTDPRGTYSKWDAKAIGSGAEGAQNALEEEYNPNLSLDEGLHLALKTLKQVMEEKVDVNNVEVATVTMEDGFKMVDKESLGQIINEILLSGATLS